MRKNAEIVIEDDIIPAVGKLTQNDKIIMKENVEGMVV